jgi:hypothetical protein
MAPFTKKVPGRRKVPITITNAPIRKASAPVSKAPTTLRPRCSCGKRHDHEKAAGRHGRTAMTWHCSSCSSSHGSSILQARAEEVDARSREAEDKLLQAKALLKNARQLESQFAERVTNPERMGKTGEPLCILLPVLQKMVSTCSRLPLYMS